MATDQRVLIASEHPFYLGAPGGDEPSRRPARAGLGAKLVEISPKRTG